MKRYDYQFKQGCKHMFKRVNIFFLSFLVFLFSGSLAAQTVTRGPYLQMHSDNGVTIHWRTDIATDSVVQYGDAPGSLTNSASDSSVTTEHEVELSSLSAAQQYWYSVGYGGGVLAGDSSHRFRTAPVAGSAADTRIWVIGDSGTANSNAAAVRDAYVSWAGADTADLWLMLGDNAYNDGTDSEYQAAVFDMYPEILKQTPLWSTLGNHDGHTADSGTQSGPYYDIFNLPTLGEIGGLQSNTEAYYSFDYANIHFVCLDSYDTDRSAGGTMMQWLEADLASNTQPWVIAFWHHPPYTKGSHNSDTEGRLIDMRQNALPVLEAWGVDLVLSGHSHSYERSYLLDGHYGLSTTLDPVLNVVDPGDGNPAGDGAYEKPDIVAAQNAGAVYAVAGSSGKISGGSLDHPAMHVSLNSLGSMVLDVSGNQMDAWFLDQTGAVLDAFTITKTPDLEPPLITGASAEDATHVLVNFNEVLDSAEATQASNYAIAGLSVTGAELVQSDQVVRLTTSQMNNGSSYTVVVNNVQDQFLNTIAPGSTADFEFFDTMPVAFQFGMAPDPGYTGASDAYIRAASATTAHGLETTLQVDGDEPSGSGTDMNIVMRWDISAIPDDAIVESARIVMEVTNPSNGSYECYGLLRAWNETEVTWNQASGGAAWGAPGASSATDRDSLVACSVNAGSTGPLSIGLNADGVDLVQTWVSIPADNHGIVVSNPSTSDGADFHSRESTNAMARPLLEVTYRVPVIEPPDSVDQFAEADLPSAGTVSGTFNATHDDDGDFQSITERESGGKKNRRYSYLSHTWRFTVAEGSPVTLHANAWSGGSSDNDDFEFQWSADNNSFQTLFTVRSTSTANQQSAVVPASGTIYIRVQDTDRTARNRALDTVYIDQLYIRSDNSTPPVPPDAPFNLQALGTSSSVIDLNWERGGTNEQSFDLERAAVGSGAWAALANPGAGSTSYSDTGLAPATTWDYRIRARNTAGVSAWSNTATGTTSDAAAISLTASGYKVKGKHHIDLVWSGASGNVDIVRDGSIIAGGGPSGSYTDNTGNKGGRTYVYRVCETGTTTCSDDQVVVF